MIKIGIVGSENSHTTQFAKLTNIEKKFRGVKTVMLWGEEPNHTKNVAEQCKIAEIVQSPEEMIGKIDLAIVDHRHAMHHVPAATPLVKAGIPTLIDKPLCMTVEEGKKFLSFAARQKTLVTSYSCVRYSDGFIADQKAISELGDLTTVDYYGPCDIDSPYGGVHFYGIHQVEMMTAQLGIDIEAVQFNKGNDLHHTATVYYKAGHPIVTLHLIKAYSGGFRYTVCGTKGTAHLALNYAGLYEEGLKAFLRMAKTGKNDFSKSELLAPVAVLESLATSIGTGEREALPSF